MLTKLSQSRFPLRKSVDSLYPLTSLPESHLYHNSFQKERGTFAITKKDLIRTMLLK